jgi:hypothetical protein
MKRIDSVAQQKLAGPEEHPRLQTPRQHGNINIPAAKNRQPITVTHPRQKHTHDHKHIITQPGGHKHIITQPADFVKYVRPHCKLNSAQQIKLTGQDQQVQQQQASRVPMLPIETHN